MIQMYANGHIAAGVLGTVATVGWVVQGLGILFYYRQVRDTDNVPRFSQFWSDS